MLCAAAIGADVTPPGMIAGPWEALSGGVLVGIHLRIDTVLDGHAESVIRMQVRVDRVVGKDWGWYVVDGDKSTWDGARLKIDHKDAVVDLIFDGRQQAWTGRLGSNPAVRLERPLESHDEITGTWKSVGGPGLTPGCLHAGVRRDGGGLIVWLDRGFERRYGEELDRLSVFHEEISFGLANAPHMFHGKLHAKQKIEGSWEPLLQAPNRFIRSSAEACASLPMMK